MTPLDSRPQKLSGYTVEMPCPCGKIYVTLNFSAEDGLPKEIFGKLGKSGGCTSCVVSALMRTASYGLRSGADLGDFIKCWRGMICHRNPAWDNGEMVNSCVDAVGRAAQEILEMHEQASGQLPLALEVVSEIPKLRVLAA